MIAWATYNSAPGHAQSLFFQKHQSIFWNLLTNGMNVVPARKKKNQKYGPGKCFKFERKINDHEIARDSAETIAPLEDDFFSFLQLKKRINY